MNPIWTNRELYEALGRHGSEEQRRAFELLYRELYAVSLFMLQNAHVAEPRELAKDCTQEAIVKIWKSLASCQQPEAVRAWAKTILRNQTLNELARHKRQHEESLEGEAAQSLVDPAGGPTQRLTRAEKYGAIVDLLTAAPLSTRSRFVILGKYLLQMAEDEICQALQEREGAEVKPSHVQVTRAKNFKKIYGDAELLRRFWELYRANVT
jgi:RNA polymerase sigma factor (sigma-70 family)